MHITELDLIVRVLIGWGLTFVLGFERAVRGAPAGDRTFSLVGAGTALIGTLSLSSPAVLGGAVTGIGFIGGGLCFRQAAQDKEILHGVTTAASIFGAAAIGAAAGVGHIWLAVIATAAVFTSLEIRHLPVFRLLDARRWQPYFHHDDHEHPHFFLREVEQAIACELEEEVVAIKEVVVTNTAAVRIPARREAAETTGQVPSGQDSAGQVPAGQVPAGHLPTVPIQPAPIQGGRAQAGQADAELVATEAGAHHASATSGATSENVEQAIETEVMADQIIEAAASRGAGR